ncbi:MAG: hypothetical protein U9Q66_04395 [Patescibacteria group bacterium]|nr:hypothetical protein [Patescibacteria group bacterium]
MKSELNILKIIIFYFFLSIGYVNIVKAEDKKIVTDTCEYTSKFYECMEAN